MLPAPDPELCRALAAWSAALKRHGDAINRIAKQLNEAKLRGEPLPPIAAALPVLRDFAEFPVRFVNDLDARCRARSAAMMQEVDKALEGLGVRPHEAEMSSPGIRPDRDRVASSTQNQE